jgi:hypothetical protein
MDYKTHLSLMGLGAYSRCLFFIHLDYFSPTIALILSTHMLLLYPSVKELLDSTLTSQSAIMVRQMIVS